jgi:hypothetical protein
VLFRGIVQSALRPVFGPAVPLASTAALGLAYVNVHPIAVALVFVGLGLVSAIVVELTGVLDVVVTARILLLVGLVYEWPRILDLH